MIPVIKRPVNSARQYLLVNSNEDDPIKTLRKELKQTYKLIINEISLTLADAPRK